MKKKPLDERCSRCATGSHGLYHMQDRLLNLRASDMLKYLGSRNKELADTIPKGAGGKETVGNAVRLVSVGMDEKDGKSGTCHRETIPPLLYLLLIEPFAQWLTETGYIPDDEFLTRTGIAGLSISHTGDIPFSSTISYEETYDYDELWN